MKKIQNKRPVYWLVIPLLVLTWIVFKWFYPFADFFTDSYTYINAAAAHDPISYRPIGYSLFLRMVYALSASDSFLTTLQYVLLQSASCLLVLFFRRWYGLSLRVERILLLFLLVDPIPHYLANYISSDALFTAMSLFWIVSLLGMIRRPSWWALIGQSILLFGIFFIRYNALYYPIVAAIAVLLCSRPVLFRGVGIVASLAVVIAGTLIVKRIALERTGIAAFSAFSGWQLANNALNMYPYIPTDTSGLPSPECRRLADFTRRYFDSVRPSLQGRAPVATTDYMWDSSSPLRQYFVDWKKRNGLPYFTAWNRVSPLFGQYGTALVRKHPLAYGRYYLWPSAKGFFLPPLEILESYNEGKKDVDTVAQKWFHYHTLEPVVYSATIQGILLAPFPWVYLVMNGVFLVLGFLFFRDGSIRARYPDFTVAARWITLFFLVNACFSIFASPGTFRYQVLTFLLLVIFTAAGLDALIPRRQNPILTRQI